VANWTTNKSARLIEYTVSFLLSLCEIIAARTYFRQHCSTRDNNCCNFRLNILLILVAESKKWCVNLINEGQGILIIHQRRVLKMILWLLRQGLGDSEKVFSTKRGSGNFYLRITYLSVCHWTLPCVVYTISVSMHALF